MGHALTLDLPEDVYRGLIHHAEQTGQPPEAVAMQLLVTAIQHQGEDPVEQFIGAFRRQGGNWVDQHDIHLGKAARRSMDPQPSKGHL